MGNWRGCVGGLIASRGRFHGRGSCGFNSATNQLQFRLRISCILAAIGPRSGRDWATIAPRSGHDRGPSRSSIDVCSIGGDSTIQTPRLRRDRGVLPQPLHAVRSIIRCLEGHDRAITIHFPRPSDVDPTVLMRRTATCLKKIN